MNDIKHNMEISAMPNIKNNDSKNSNNHLLNRTLDRINSVASAQAEYDTPFGTFLTYLTYWCMVILILPVGCAYGLWLYLQAQTVDPATKKYRGIAIFSVISLVIYLFIVLAMIIAWKLGYINIDW